MYGAGGGKSSRSPCHGEDGVDGRGSAVAWHVATAQAVIVRASSSGVSHAAAGLGRVKAQPSAYPPASPAVASPASPSPKLFDSTPAKHT